MNTILSHLSRCQLTGLNAVETDAAVRTAHSVSATKGLREGAQQVFFSELKQALIPDAQNCVHQEQLQYALSQALLKAALGEKRYACYQTELDNKLGKIPFVDALLESVSAVPGLGVGEQEKLRAELKQAFASPQFCFFQHQEDFVSRDLLLSSFKAHSVS